MFRCSSCPHFRNIFSIDFLLPVHQPAYLNNEPFACLSFLLWHHNWPDQLKIEAMKIIGIILIAAGILMLVFRGFNFTQEKEIVDIGPIEISKKENKTVVWPTYAGVIALVAGVALIAFDKKTKTS